MCHTHQTDQMPLTQASGSTDQSDFGAPASTDANGVSAPSPLPPGVDPLNATGGARPSVNLPVTRTTGFGDFMQNLGLPGAGHPDNDNGKLTKWGMLARVLGPALQGGLIGLAGGKGHPGGGFGAAQDFYDRQRAFQMQKMMLQRQQVNDQFKNLLEYARTLHEMQLPPISRVPNAIKGHDPQGNEIYMTLNPHTLRYEPIEGIQPESNADYAATNTDQGIVTYDKHGQAPTRLLTLPGATTSGAVPLPGGSGSSGAVPLPSSISPSGAVPLPTRPPFGIDNPSRPNFQRMKNPITGVTSRTGPFDEIPGSPGGLTPGSGTASQSPSGVAASIPLRSPGYNTPKAVVRASRNGAGIETDNILDTNPNSPTFGKKIASTDNTRQPVPDRAADRTDKTNEVNSQVETYAAEALKRNGNDPDKAIQFLNGLQVGDPDAQKRLQAMLPKIRQHIRDRSKQGKKRLSPSPEDAKAAGLSPTASSVTDDEEQ